MIAAATDPRGQRLDPGDFNPVRLGKAPVETPRRAAGIYGNGVRFGASTNHLAALLLPLTLCRLHIVRDGETAG
jgi:hypothetical protein